MTIFVLLKKTLGILLNFVKTTAETRLFLQIQEEKSPPWENYLFSSLQSFGRKFSEYGLKDLFEKSQNWAQIASQILNQDNGEKILKDIQDFQDNFGFGWKEGEPTDPGAEMHPNFMLNFLRESIILNESAKEKKETPQQKLSYAELQKNIFRGVMAFQKILLSSGEKIKMERIFKNEKDIFFLTYKELLKILDAPQIPPENRAMLTSLIQERRKAFAYWKKLFPPYQLPENSIQRDLPQTLSGKILCPGKVEGFARFIRSPKEISKISKEDILIFPFLNTSWLPLLRHAGGFVLDSSYLSPDITHALKHVNLPTLIGVEDASRIIPKGTQIQIDGEKVIIKNNGR